MGINLRYALFMCCLIHLKGVNISQPVLHVAVHNQFAQTQHFSAEMKGIPKSGLLSFLWTFYTELSILGKTIQMHLQKCIYTF